jgi:hypothetical protein
MAVALAGAFGGGLEPVVTGDYRLGDVRHVVASPAGAAADLGFRAQTGFTEGMAEFAHAALREPALAGTARMLDPHGVPDGRPTGSSRCGTAGSFPRMLDVDPRS